MRRRVLLHSCCRAWMLLHGEIKAAPLPNNAEIGSDMGVMYGEDQSKDRGYGDDQSITSAKHWCHFSSLHLSCSGEAAHQSKFKWDQKDTSPELLQTQIQGPSRVALCLPIKSDLCIHQSVYQLEVSKNTSRQLYTARQLYTSQCMLG